MDPQRKQRIRDLWYQGRQQARAAADALQTSRYEEASATALTSLALFAAGLVEIVEDEEFGDGR